MFKMFQIGSTKMFMTAFLSLLTKLITPLHIVLIFQDEATYGGPYIYLKFYFV